MFDKNVFYLLTSVQRAFFPALTDKNCGVPYSAYDHSKEEEEELSDDSILPLSQGSDTIV